jgi:GDP-L-fucose synthase
VNIGRGTDISIKELAELIVAEGGYDGQLEFDTTKTDGTLRKLLDKIKLKK